jgi:hypothetical protein
METLLTGFRNRCQEAVLDLLWRQWCSLGVSGHAAMAQPGRLIDLESLVLATTSFGRHDPRLFDEAFDWLASFGSLINLQRLANLRRGHPLGDGRVLAALAEWLVRHAGQPRWKAIAKGGPESEAGKEPEPLFLGIGGPETAIPDPIFLAWGYERTKFQPRGMSRAHQPMLQPNLMASLRALIGVSSRVEILLYLAGSPTAAGAAEIARATGYAPRTLQVVLQEMMLSGHLLSQEPPAAKNNASKRRPRGRYHVQPSDWAFLTSGKPLPRWTPWASIFTLARSVLTSIPGPESRSVHPAVVSSRLRGALSAEGPALAAAGLLPGLDLRPDAPGSELLQTLSDRLPALIGSL